MARVIVCCLAMAVLAAPGCARDPSALAPAAFGAPLVAEKCERTYRHEVLGFGLTPPDGSTGPDIVGASKELFVGTWTAPSGRQYRVVVTNIGTDSFQDAIGTVRGNAVLRGDLLDDRPIALDSGRVGWLMTTGSRGGTTKTAVYDMRRGYLFTLDVDVSGATSTELDVVHHVIQSFCVDP